MKYLGDFVAGATVRFMFSTNAAAGSRVDFSSALEVADIRVYKNGSTTERSSTAGYTVTSGFDSMVGVHFVAIDTSDNTDAGFYAAAGDYTVVIYPDETVDSLSVAAIGAEFSIENRAPLLATPTLIGLGPRPFLGILDSGTAQSATATTLVLRAATPIGADDVANGVLIAAYGATQGYWQYRYATDYVTSTDTVTVDTWTVTPSGALTYVAFASAPASATALPAVNVTQLLGTAWLTPAVAGTPDVNAKQISGDATAADNAEAFFDGTGYAGTNNVIPTVSTLTGNTAQTGDSFARIGATGSGLTSLATPTNITAATGVVLGATGSAALTESYAADGAAATLPQLLYLTLAALTEFSKSGTTVTLKKLDGSTTAATLTLSDASDPTSITRAT